MTHSGVNESRLSRGHKESGKRLDLIYHIFRTLCLCWSYSDIRCKMPTSIDSGIHLKSRLSRGHKESGKRLDLIYHIFRTLCLCWSYSDIRCKMPTSIDSGIHLSAPVSIESSLSALLTPRR